MDVQELNKKITTNNNIESLCNEYISMLTEIHILDKKKVLKKEPNNEYTYWNSLDEKNIYLYHKYFGKVLARVSQKGYWLSFRKVSEVTNKVTKHKFKNIYLFIDEKMENNVPSDYFPEFFSEVNMDDKNKIKEKIYFSNNIKKQILSIVESFGILIFSFSNGQFTDLTVRDVTIDSTERILTLLYSSIKSEFRTKRIFKYKF